MKLIKNLLPAAGIMLLAANASAEHFKVQVPMSDEEPGAKVFMMDFDTGAKIDSTTVKDQSAVFEGEIDEPVLARIVTDNNRYGMFILEGGSISFSATTGEAFGSMQNDRLREFQAKEMELQNKFRAAQTDNEKEEIYNSYLAEAGRMLKENPDNALGYYFFVMELPSLDYKDMKARVDQYPAFAKKERVQKYLQQAQARENTQPGDKFVDFEITYDGKTSRLSDHVGRGHYTLVDFWASWCGPCIRQTHVLKDIYNEYKDKGLEVLGVAVWDEPENTKTAITRHELPWECILNAQTIPTDLYGISGIPCIILFGPDGTILSRDKQDDELRADVRRFLEGENK